MNILAIETSCDETGVAIVKTFGRKRVRFDILSNIVASQIKIHRKWGGVYPALAKREHQKNLLPVLKKALKKAKLLKRGQKIEIKNQELEEILRRERYLLKEIKNFFKNHQRSKIDLIAVTIGPGLEPCLWTGINFAKALAFTWKLPVIPVNHIEAHILANFIDNSQFITHNSQLFPAICLVVSGGHTQLILMKKIGNYKILGETRDDAAGECFDKVARILGLGYPGGPAIEAAASKIKIKDHKLSRLPRPMIHQKNLDFSFSGLKTAVLYYHRNQPPKIKKSKEYVRAMALEIQQAIIDVLISKTIKAAKAYKARTIILGGGVTANKELRYQLKEKIKRKIPNTKYLIPDTKYSTDNALMIAVTAHFHWPRQKRNWKEIKAEANLRIN
jgi:N6-L-threonylcarbamoyladenine synthase